ncbi:PJA2 ligase, partial [Steatornis caripensis]|nr:PJA2 ligase [Steatornis caripensis]
MGQEAGRLAWTKQAGGYQTITRRRYGRRHACVNFGPSLDTQNGEEHQHNEDCEQSELEDVQIESALCSIPLVQVSSGLLDEPVLENTGTGEPVCQSVSRRAFEVDTSPFSLLSYGLEGNKISGNFMNPYENFEDLAEYASGGCNDLNGQSGIAFVNIDSYEPDSSDGEEDDSQDRFSFAREEAGVLQEMLDNMLSELEIDVESFTDLQSRLSTLSHCVSREYCKETGPIPSMRCYDIDSDLACPNNRTLKSSAEDQAIRGSTLSGANCETQQIKNTVEVGIGTPIAIANELNVSDGRADQGNSLELVVRPKIRKQNAAKQLEREKLICSDDEEESGSWRRREIAEVQQGHAECALRNGKLEMSSSVFFDLREYEDHQKNTEIDLRKNAAAQEQKSMLDDSAFWDEFEHCSRHFSMSHEDEDSSELSDGEWSTGMLTYFTATEQDESSDDESWETVPGKEECEPEVESSGIEEESRDFCFHRQEQTLLEEGEIPWLQYQEEVESSSDEENDPVSDFVHPVFFLLDGNNNLEDDSSVSEDLEVEWRLLDEFGDGLGLTQTIPYVDPHFFTFMALEGHLQQAMEAALAHLESLEFDVEQAHPPATKETVDCLPQIIITDDHAGQDQRCTICCSEYVKDEIITELPCHHLFHKPCVTLWLQKSGTCPICRHVLAPVLPEAAAATVSFLSDLDSTSSV